MTWFYISYDLRRPGQNYSRLYKQLTDLGGHRVLESLWLVKWVAAPAPSAEAVRDMLTPYIDSNDRLLVVQSAASAWNGNVLVNPLTA